MVYEIVLTDLCTRKCNFCWVSQTGYIASQDDIQKFSEEVLVKESNASKKPFRISLFGGEPLLNPNGIRQVIDIFKSHSDKINIDICTNGDLFEEFQKDNKDLISQLNWGISSYDIFSDPAKCERYLNIAKSVDAVLMYTFTSNDIDKVFQFSDLCWNNNIKFKIAFSHSENSWKNIDSKKLYDLVFKIFYSELSKTIEKFPHFKSIAIMKPLKTILGYILGGYKKKKCWCIDNDEKISFYKGKIVGSCMQEYNNNISSTLSSKPIPKKCISCDYVQICTKSCIFEHDIFGNVPNNLCAIEKAQLDAFCKFAIDKKQNNIWRTILKRLLENDRNDYD